MLERRGTYRALYDEFRWRLPQRFNIGEAIADRWARHEPERVAIVEHRATGKAALRTFGELARQSDLFASALRKLGLGRGDRVAIVLPQCFETVVAHAAVYKLGAVAVPLAILFGGDALRYRLAASGARTAVVNDAGLARLRAIRRDLPRLEHIIAVDGSDGDALDFHRLIADGAEGFTPASTGPDDPAMMIFTSGTTGPPKGALHGHRVLLGHLPGVQMHHEFLPRPGDRLWTPADWAWAGGLLNVLLPGLYLGVPVVATRFQGFDPGAALSMMEQLRVRNAFLPATALRVLRAAPDAFSGLRLDLRTIGSAGESLGRETFEWARERFGVPVNEFYGQTECNAVLSSCAGLGVSRAGAIGRPVPGHAVVILDGEGRRAPAGTAGQIAVRRPDPVMFLGYWEDEPATAKKFVADWMTTGDQGVEDEDGYFHFLGRDDDIITSAGYRIGPGEVEDCLASHPAVALAAVVGKPDALRTEIVKAFVVLQEGITGDATLEAELKRWVRERLSAHEYPREMEFVGDLPLTTTGKIIRRALRDRDQTEVDRS